MKKLFILLILFSTFSCSVVKVSSVYDENKDFSKYKTYALNEEVFELHVEEANRELILTALENEMIKEGFTKSSDPDIIVNVLLAGEKFEQVTEASNNFYYHGFTEGTLVISFIDASSQKIAWQGTGTKAISKDITASKREANVKKAIDEILESYPPK